MGIKQKLELTWIGKEQAVRVEPRILLYDEKRSYGNKLDDNILIHGDNLVALKALEQEYAGKVKCIYIDPPYNTGSMFEHYEDNLEHSIWLNQMKPRLEILKGLLREDGFFCCHIDDSEGHYLKLLLDEIFGRQNYLTTLYIRVRYPEKTLKVDMDFHKEIEQIFVYRKKHGAKPNLDVQEVGLDKFCYYVEEIGQGEEVLLGGKKVEIFNKDQYKIVKKEGSEYGLKEIWASGTILDGNSSGRFFRDYLTGRYEEDGYGVLYKVYDIGDDRYPYRYFTGPKKIGATKGKYYQGIPVKKLEEDNMTRTIPINGFYDFAAQFGNCRQEGGVEFRSGKKPEALLEMILKYFSDEGDIVLDSFLGSGTTAAVAHKMKRKWIGIEMGEQCYSHCQTRLSRVIDGDTSGISESVNWRGGGGYNFYEVPPSLLKKDKYGNWIINKDIYTATAIAAAVAKYHGFTYHPDEEVFWKQGYSYENDYIFTTDQMITVEYIDLLHSEMKSDESLLICCPAYQQGLEERYDNINIEKIPQSILDKYDFGVESYNMKINDTVVDEVATTINEEE
ncbi:MAG: site-specific DNA-methyltransferase [Cellulosilyticum sp.]|nr:site-specific DNA-methyltransferase [Cellulosilyticum sp.]